MTETTPGWEAPLAAATPAWRSERQTRNHVAGFVVAVAGEVGIAGVVASGGPLTTGREDFPILFCLWAITFVIAGLMARRLPRHRAVGLILVAGIALRVAALAGPPTTSDDLYRYSWDGRVQAAGVDAYAQPPEARQLANLREPWLWPDAATCAALHKAPPCTRVNRPDVRTIYPPVAEAWFAAVYRFTGIGARYKAWQVTGLLTELATLGLLVVALKRWGRDPRWLALYALCPAPVIEIVNNGHVDGLAIALVVAALIVVVPPDRSQWAHAPPWRDLAAAALIGAAALVKLYPAIFLLPLVAYRPGRRRGTAVRAGATVTALTAIAYAPHVARVGTKVLGYLPGYLNEEHYHSGGRFLIAGVLQIPDAWAGAVSLFGFGIVASWVLVRRPSVPVASAAIMAALLVASSPAQSWYAVTLLALATVAGRPALVAVVAAGYFASFSVVLDRAGSATIGGWAFTGALVVVLVAAGWRRGRPTRGDGPRPGRPAREPAGADGLLAGG